MTETTLASPNNDLQIVPATIEDVPAIKAMVDAAYSKYIPRIGKPPAPMAADHGLLIQTQNVSVLKVNDETVGSLVLSVENDAVKINNLVVDPSAQGRGYGRVLIQHAENVAKARLKHPACTLFTNAKMYENLALYVRMGFVETVRKMEDGFERAYFRKDLI